MLRSLGEGARAEHSAVRTTEPMESPHDRLILTKFSEGEDIEAYITTFERLMTVYKIPESCWAIKLAPQLSG